MKSFKLAILFSALAIAGCGDKNDADTAQQSGDTLLEQAQDMTSSAVESADQAASSAGESISDAADAVQEETAAAADEAAAAADAGMDAGADMTDQAATATGDAVDAGQEMAADAAAAAEETVAAAGETADEAAGAAAAMAPAAGADATAGMDLALGQTVYQGKCQACHASGAAGAPKMGDTANWAPRIAQGMDTLFKHSIEGFKGSVGYMPPKGGFTSLSDDEVKAAVAYMVSENQ